MLTDLTIRQLQRYAGPASGTEEIARLGYLQWLGGLDADQSYPAAAARACALARPFEGSAPAVAAFCALLRRSLAQPLVPLDLPMPAPRRRGGARHRRAWH
jgi:hypothetical protein